MSLDVVVGDEEIVLVLRNFTVVLAVNPQARSIEDELQLNLYSLHVSFRNT